MRRFVPFMTQTMKNQNSSVSKRGRPGQRQQERLMRQVRRQKRQRVTLTVVALLLLCVVVAVGFWQYERYTADQATLKDQHATATAKALITPTPVVGPPTQPPATPPAVTGNAVKLPDGLQYVDVKEGVGPAAKKGDTVTVIYTGWIQSSGKKFDSSYDENKQTFDVTPLGTAQVIAGWNEGLVGIKSGGTRRLIIPPALGYGSAGSPPVIPANATLIFDVTAVAVK